MALTESKRARVVGLAVELAELAIDPEELLLSALEGEIALRRVVLRRGGEHPLAPKRGIRADNPERELDRVERLGMLRSWGQEVRTDFLETMLQEGGAHVVFSPRFLAILWYALRRRHPRWMKHADSPMEPIPSVEDTGAWDDLLEGVRRALRPRPMASWAKRFNEYLPTFKMALEVAERVKETGSVKEAYRDVAIQHGMTGASLKQEIARAKRETVVLGRSDFPWPSLRQGRRQKRSR